MSRGASGAGQRRVGLLAAAALCAKAKPLLRARETVLLLILVLMFAVFSVWSEGFWNPQHLFRQSRYWVATGIIAVPMTFVIATAGIDLSVGSMVALSGVVLGLLYNAGDGIPLGAAALAAVAAGTTAGAFNGVVSSYAGIPPLVVTLATMALFRGAAMGLSRARVFRGFPSWFLWISKGNILPPFTETPGALYIPVSTAILLAIFALGWVLLRKSWAGRFTECIGENETAARFAAIDVRLMKTALYAASGVACGIAALFHTALYASAKADTALGMELEVIACVVVGGTRISGGQGTVAGSLLGLLIIGILRYGLLMADVKSQHIIIYVGILLVTTAVFNEWMAARRGGRQ